MSKYQYSHAVWFIGEIFGELKGVRGEMSMTDEPLMVSKEARIGVVHIGVG